MLKINKLAAVLVAALGIIVNQGIVEAAQTPIKKLEINGDIRFSYGNFKFKTDYGTLKNHYKEVNTKLSALYSFDKANTLNVGVCDVRITNAHENDRRAYINRAFFSSNNKKYGFSVGRIPHYELDNNVLYAYENYLDGTKLRLGPEKANVELFGGALGKGQNRQKGYYIKGTKVWKHWTAKSVFFDFDKSENMSPWNHQKIWSNSVSYKFDDKVSLQYERLNFAGQNWGKPSSSQSGYVAGITWSNFDIIKPNTFFMYLNYYRQPQGSYFKGHHGVIALVDQFDWSGPGYEQGARGFEGPGFYLGYALAKGVVLNLEAYKYKNIYAKDTTFKHEAVAAYLNVFF